jgi:ATP-dependent Clp protease ATP-binding subunit ClpB
MHSKQEHDRLIAMKTDLEIAKNRIDRLQQEGEFEKASKLLYIEIPNLEKEIHQLEEKINSQNSSFKDAVGAKEIAMVISRATGIQLSKLTLNQNDKLAELPGYLKSRVIGQERAVSVVSDAILRSKAGVNDPNRPIGSFLFLGPTGVGKTELAKSLAYALFDTEKAMIRFDMSEYMEKHSVAKLIGSPPGYVGYEQPGLLSNAVRLHPYSVLLFDEIDKAHPDILNLLLQILDDGVLHDAKGNIINFKNTIIIMTSNIGAQEILDGHPSQAIEVLKKFVRPEFINRIDEVVTFNQIEKDNVAKIAEKLLSELTERLVKDDIHIVFEKSVIAKVAKDGFDPIYGARPLKRFIQSRVENFLAQQIIEGQIKKNIKYATTVDKNGGLIIKEARAD